MKGAGATIVSSNITMDKCYIVANTLDDSKDNPGACDESEYFGIGAGLYVSLPLLINCKCFCIVVGGQKHRYSIQLVVRALSPTALFSTTVHVLVLA